MTARETLDPPRCDLQILDLAPESSGDLKGLITQLLPDQGAIEVQRDVPGKTHAWHSHPTDETLVILDGELHFYWGGGEAICGPNTMICLPSGVPHGSTALGEGATYLIAFHQAEVPTRGGT
jgi:quercetin dioxygenase-like cupin family protein